MNGKLQLYGLFQQKSIKSSLEAFIPPINQRPDILVQSNDVSTAIEFQCSQIPAVTIIERNMGYHLQKIAPLWILRTPSIKELPPREIGFMKLSSFRQQFFLSSRNYGKMIITYCPQTKYFHYLSNPVHIKTNLYIVKVKKLPIAKQSWPFAYVKRITFQEFETYLSMYREQRFKHLANLFYYNKKGIQSPFLRVCYKWQIYPKNLPLFIGIPSAYAESFHVHAVEWQIQFIDYLNTLGIGINQATIFECKSFLYDRPIGSSNFKQRLEAVKSYLFVIQQCINQSEKVIYKSKIHIGKMNRYLYSQFLAN